MSLCMPPSGYVRRPTCNRTSWPSRGKNMVPLRVSSVLVPCATRPANGMFIENTDISTTSPEPPELSPPPSTGSTASHCRRPLLSTPMRTRTRDPTSRATFAATRDPWKKTSPLTPGAATKPKFFCGRHAFIVASMTSPGAAAATPGPSTTTPVGSPARRRREYSSNAWRQRSLVRPSGAGTCAEQTPRRATMAQLPYRPSRASSKKSMSA
mmetsp:Transcript_32154/g.99112  ORF Transcript_32154/g.99112 Transcript_32154/m.99112 type:complete len:211 (+) Transcript_32154:358-990(+)